MSECGCCGDESCIWEDLKYHELWIELTNGKTFVGTLRGTRDEDWLVFEGGDGHLRYVDRYAVVQVSIVYDN